MCGFFQLPFFCILPPMHAFLLAGGFATRLWPLTEHRAKPLLPLAGKPMLTHIVEKIPAGMPITVSTNAVFAEGFTQWQETLTRPNVNVVIEQTKSDDQKLGALGAVAQWIEQENINDDILLITGDNYCGFAITDFLNAYTKDVPLLAAYDIGELEKAKAFGTVIVEMNGIKEKEEQEEQEEQEEKEEISPLSPIHRVLAFEEKPKEPKTTLVSTGCSIIPASALPTLISFSQSHPDNVGGIFEEFLRRGIPVQCFTFKEPWFDVGSFHAYLDATKTLVGEQYLAGIDSTLVNTICEGSVVIGKNCTIINSTLQNTVIFDNCTIEDCILEDCVLDNNCHLSHADMTGKMMREGTTLRRSI